MPETTTSTAQTNVTTIPFHLLLRKFFIWTNLECCFGFMIIDHKSYLFCRPAQPSPHSKIDYFHNNKITRRCQQFNKIFFMISTQNPHEIKCYFITLKRGVTTDFAIAHLISPIKNYLLPITFFISLDICH